MSFKVGLLTQRPKGARERGSANCQASAGAYSSSFLCCIAQTTANTTAAATTPLRIMSSSGPNPIMANRTILCSSYGRLVVRGRIDVFPVRRVLRLFSCNVCPRVPIVRHETDRCLSQPILQDPHAQVPHGFQGVRD